MLASRFKSDAKQLDPNVPLAKVASHSNYLRHLADIGNKEGMRILEIGSREVTGASDARKRFAKAEYVGFDYYPGPNVDVVGDAHKLYRNTSKTRSLTSSIPAHALNILRCHG
jgi:hypothetical protein